MVQKRASASGGCGSPDPKGRIIDTKQSPLRPQRINTKDNADFCPQYPAECLFVAKKFLFLRCLGCTPKQTYRKVFSLFVRIRKCSSFQRIKDKRTALISCLDVGRDVFCVPVSHIYPSVGYRIVYLIQGPATTF